LAQVIGKRKLRMNQSVHLAGVLGADGKLSLYVDGKRVAKANGQFITKKPSDALSIGADTGSAVGKYDAPMPFEGELTDIRIYWGVLDDASLGPWAGQSK